MNDDMPESPLAYLITFRTYGTWLHGDARGSISRDNNGFGTPVSPTNLRLNDRERSMLGHEPVTLGPARRRATRQAVLETCGVRGWHLYTLNVRTNHVHAVVSAQVRPERIVSAFKANATRIMRSSKCWTSPESPWWHGGSTRYVWTESGLERAIAYVRDGQGVQLDRDA
jgi:REP element-mobilizing transposase RayT